MADESVVVRVAREYREQLARNEDEALRRMAKAWAKMETELFDSFVAVSQQIQDLQAQGVAIPKQLIYNQKRYQQMLAQVQKNLTEYDETAIQTIKTYQRKNYNLGLDSANATLKATSPSSAVWNEVSRDTAEVMVGFAGNGAPLAELMKRDYGSLAEEITDALVTGIGLGKGAYATAKDMRDAMGMEYNRSVRIARTETNRAYRIANAEQYAKSGVVEKVLRLCYPPTACFACLMMDGEECPNGICDDHPNGKCTTIAVTIGGHYPEWQKGSEWLLQQDEATQRRIMGDGRYELWQKDGVPLRDMVTMKENPVWGGSPTVLTINDIKQNNQNGKITVSLPSVLPQAPRIFTPATTREEAEDFAKQWAKKVDYSRISVENCNKINKTLDELTTKYPINELEIIGGKTKGKAVMSACYDQLNINRNSLGAVLDEGQKRYEALQQSRRTEIELIKGRYKNGVIPKDVQKRIEKLENLTKFTRWTITDSNPDHVESCVRHEYGHILADQYFGQINKEWANPNFKNNPLMQEMINKWREARMKAIKTGDIYKLSEYGSTNDYEFLAESFSAREAGETLPDYVSSLLDEVIKNGIM